MYTRERTSCCCTSEDVVSASVDAPLTTLQREMLRVACCWQPQRYITGRIIASKRYIISYSRCERQERCG